MGGGQSKGKAWHQIIDSAKLLLREGEVDKALVLLEQAEKLPLPRDADEETRRSEMQKLREDATELRSAIVSRETQAMRDLDQIEGQFIKALYAVDSDSLLWQVQDVSSSVKLFLQEHRGSKEILPVAAASLQPWSQHAKHDSLLIKGSMVQCSNRAAVRSIFLGSPLVGGKVYCEIQLGNFIVDAKAELFFGVVNPDSVNHEHYWFDEHFNDKAFFLSSDGDLCNGGDVLQSIDASSWRLDANDTLSLEFEYDGNGGSLIFYKQCRKIPFQLTNIKFSGVVAVLFSDCPTGAHIIVLSYYRIGQLVPSAMAVAADEAKETSLSKLEAILLYLKALNAIIELCKDFPTVSIKECLDLLLSIKESLRGIQQMSLTERMERLMYTVSTSLRYHKILRLDDVMQSGLRMLESDKVAKSIEHYEDATQMVRIISDMNMTHYVSQCKRTALQRKEVFVRNANSKLQTIYARIHSKDIQILQSGISALLSAAEECYGMFDNCSEVGKCQEVSTLKQMLLKLEEASLLLNEASEKMQQGRLSKVSFHFILAKENFQKAKPLVYVAGNESWIRYIDEEIAAVGSELLAASSESHSDSDEFVAEFDQAARTEENEQSDRILNHVNPILKGDFHYRREVKQNIICIYVTSSISEHEQERNFICENLKTSLRLLARSWGFELEIFDPLHLLPPAHNYPLNLQFHADSSSLRTFCRIASCSIDYICLLGSSSNGKAFPRRIDQKQFESILLQVGDHGQDSKRRKAILDWYRLDTNSNPHGYVLVESSNRSSGKSRPSRDKVDEAWTKAFRLMQEGFHEACVQQVISKQKQVMRDAILGKLGVLDSSSMKRRVKELFNEIDSDGSGLIESEELEIAFERLGIHLGSNEISEFVKDFDEDGSGTIDFEEFLLMVEGLLLDAKNSRSGNALDDIAHCKYFTETFEFLETFEGLLSRKEEEARAKSIAILWNHDTATSISLGKSSLAEYLEMYQKVDRSLPYTISELKAMIFHHLSTKSNLNDDDSLQVEDTLEFAHGDDTEIMQLLKLRRSTILRSMSMADLQQIFQLGRRRKFQIDSSPLRILDRSSREISETTKLLNEILAKIENQRQRLNNAQNVIEKSSIEASIRQLELSILPLQSEIDKCFFIVLSGRCQVTYEDVEGKADVYFMDEGSSFGEAHLFQEQNLHYQVDLVTDVVLLQVNGQDSVGFFARRPYIQSALQYFDGVCKRRRLGREELKAEPWLSVLEASRLTEAVLGAEMLDNLLRQSWCVTVDGACRLWKESEGERRGWGPFGDCVYVLVEGEVSVSIDLEDSEGQVEVERTERRGEVLGLTIYQPHEERSFNLSSTRNCTLLELDKSLMTRVLENETGRGTTRLSMDERVMRFRLRRAMYEKRSKLFKTLAPEELEFLIASCRIRHCKKEEIIASKDDDKHSMIIILRGDFEIVFSEVGASYQNSGFLRAGDAVGELSFLFQTPKTFTLKTFSSFGIVAELSHETCRHYFMSQPELLKRLERCFLSDKEGMDVVRVRTPNAMLSAHERRSWQAL
eukprot:767372-Hanusia_phi.AAC.1